MISRGAAVCLQPTPGDFHVDELLPYSLSGEGGHLFVHIEKTGIDTLALVRRLAEVTGVREDDIGLAGLKDRWAVARQWLSLPDGAALEAALAGIEDDSVRVIATTRHGNKLRRGHVAANRFRIRLRSVPEGGLRNATQTLTALKERGLPNPFGRQRFGRMGDNARRGVELLRQKGRRGRLRGLLLSSVQSAVFNRVLGLRLSTGTLGVAMHGDLMQKHDTGGLFDVEAPSDEQPRADRVAISATGPMVGKRMRSPSGEPAQIEADAVAACGLTEADLPRFGRGTRRPLRIPCDPDALVGSPEPGTLELTFSMPSGSYATVLLDELVKPDGGMFERERPTA